MIAGLSVRAAAGLALLAAASAEAGDLRLDIVRLNGSATRESESSVASLRVTEAVTAGERVRTGGDGHVVLQLPPVGALMLGAIQRDESLSEFVLERVNQILGARTGNVEPEMDKSIGYATAALVLSLPRSKLEQMVVTRAQVAQLVADIKETVQRAVVGATLEGYAGRAPVGVSLNLGTLDADISILGKEFIASPAGGAMSAKFHESLLILLHNAQRLEELAELDADPENLVEWEDRPLIDLLNEHVPANFDAALAFSMEQAPAPRTLTIQPGEIKTPANPQQAETHVDAGAATGTQSSGLDTAPEAPKPFRVKRKDGSLFDARLYVSPLVDAKGNQTGWMTSMTDITEPNRIREQLQASHERFTTVLEALDASVSVAPLGSEELLFANKLYRLWFGGQAAGHLQMVAQAGVPEQPRLDESLDAVDSFVGLPTGTLTAARSENCAFGVCSSGIFSKASIRNPYAIAL